jgi:hypothetical protein
MPADRRRRKKRSFTLSRNVIRRLFLVVPFVLVAGLLTISISRASLQRFDRPDLALTLQPWDARAQARAAYKVFQDVQRGPSRLAEVERLALDALRRDPTVVSAWSTLGLVAIERRNVERAAALFSFSGRLSNRDLPTQLYQIEERVRANDIPGALRYYDIALRTNDDSYPVLFPVLVAATANDGILGPLGALLNTRPPWRRAFLEQLVAGPPDAARFVQLTGIIAGSMNEDEKSLTAQAMRQMVDRRQYQAAAGVYRLLARTPPQLVRNGAFDRPNAYPPFDWLLQSGADLGAEQLPLEGGTEGRLRIYGVSGGGGLVARQLLLLPPGRYQIAALITPGDDARPAPLSWSVQCTNEQSTLLLRQELAPAARPSRPTVSFSVPAGGCAAQWLDLSLRSDFQPRAAASMVDDIVIRRIG